MSEYDELVTRLRDGRIQHSVMGPVAMRDAADVIEALVGEVERLKSALDRAGNPQLPRPASAYVEMRDERDALKAEVERLKGVLQNIAHFEPDRKSWSVTQARSALEAKP